MATWVETNDSFAATIHRKGRRADSTVKQVFRVFDAVTDIEVHNEANTRFSGAFYNVGDYTLMVESYDITCLGNRVYEVTVTYVKTGADADDSNPLHRTRSFDTTGATSKLCYQPDGSEQRYGTNPPDMSGAINADGETVQGVDVIVPSLQWTETYDVPSTYVTAAYIKTLSQITGCVNNGAFRTFAAGEVLFAGSQGSQEWDTEKGDGPWRLTYKFIASPNAGPGQTWPAITIGAVSGIVKDGHDYLWVRYKKTEKDKIVVNEPEHVYVNRVYRRTSFASLGIGS